MNALVANSAPGKLGVSLNIKLYTSCVLAYLVMTPSLDLGKRIFYVIVWMFAIAYVFKTVLKNGNRLVNHPRLFNTVKI